VEAAVIDGWAAWAIARMLSSHCREQIEELPAHLRAPLEDATEALQHAGERWAISARGSTEALPAEAPVTSNCREELTASEVADVLKVTERRIRQLATAGALPGKQKAGRWSFEPGAVLAYQERSVGNGK
jgi:hypothetical protein